jgi:hypothetical protein
MTIPFSNQIREVEPKGIEELGRAVSCCCSSFDAIRFSKGVAAVKTTEEARTH